MTNEEFFDLLERHDWYYNYSDDHRVWKKGSEASKRLQAIIQENDLWTRMYLAYSDYIFKPLQERQSLEAPKLEDFV